MTFENPTFGELSGDSKPAPAVFTCLVYLRKNPDSSVSGRVANLRGIEVSGNSERYVLSTVAKEFKQLLLKMTEQGQAVPWVNPPEPALENEQVRSIPVHL